VLVQIAAEEIGIPPERVTITSEFTTESVPFDLGTYGSRTTYVAGNAVKAAAADAKRQLLESAARLLETSVEDLEIRDEKIHSRNSSKQVSISDVVMNTQYGLSGSSTIMGKASVEAQSCPYVFGAHFAEVEVDIESGETKVLRMILAHDVGKALNPTLVEGQLEGAAYMGLGYALKEELLWDSTTGVLLNPDFLDYKTYQAEDMPKIETIIVETNEPTGPFGAKSVGEQALIPVAPAIANAIYNAIGIRIREIPITPERALAALEAASSDRQVPRTRQTLN
jgi:CO/xanthine dehydrogenase Mo-binding subunit